MKLGVALTTPEVVNAVKIGFSGQNFAAMIEKIAMAGFGGVELMPLDPGGFDGAAVEKIIQSAGLEVPAVGTGLISGVMGLTLCDDDPAKSKAAWERFQRIVDFAARFGALVNIGSLRGRLAADSGGGIKPEALDRAVAVLGRCAAYAASYNLRIGIEPLNRYESNFINSTAEGIAFVKRSGVTNLGLVLDTFHMNIEDPSFEAALTAAQDDLFHIHIGDSNRRPPGCGHIDFALIVAALKKMGYQGYLSGELIPWPDQETALKTLTAILGSLIK